MKPVKNGDVWQWGNNTSPTFKTFKECREYGRKLIVDRLKEIRKSLSSGNPIQTN
jgi:hypothetical protein